MSDNNNHDHTASPSTTFAPAGPFSLRSLSPKIAFLLVSFCLGGLGDGLNIFQGIYLVGVGWNEGSVGLALSLMGLTALIVQPWAGDWVDKTTVDRRVFLGVASILTAMSASAILFVGGGDTDKIMIYITKVVEGISASFINPCLASLTLATFGPHHFDAIMASNILWGHVGSVAAAILAGLVSYIMYPTIKYCFIVIGASALLAVAFVPYLPQGDPLMGRGFQGAFALDEAGHVEKVDSDDEDLGADAAAMKDNIADPNHVEKTAPVAASYWEVFSDIKTCILCLTGFFFQ